MITLSLFRNSTTIHVNADEYCVYVRYLYWNKSQEEERNVIATVFAEADTIYQLSCSFYTPWKGFRISIMFGYIILPIPYTK